MGPLLYSVWREGGPADLLVWGCSSRAGESMFPLREAPRSVVTVMGARSVTQPQGHVTPKLSACALAALESGSTPDPQPLTGARSFGDPLSIPGSERSTDKDRRAEEKLARASSV